MGDVLVVGCGGAAGFIIEDFQDNHDKDNARFEEFDTYSIGMSTTTIDELRKKFRKCRIVVPFIVLGGEFGTDRVREIIGLARESGCKVVSVLGIPMEFERERRERALSRLSDLTSASDCTFVMDVQRFFGIEENKNKMFADFIRASDRAMMFCIATLVEYMSGPFFSTFTRSMYSFILCRGMIPENAVIEGWNALLFDENPELDDVVIMVSGRANSSEVDGIRDRVARDYGILPQVIRRADEEETKVLIFRAVRSF